MGDLVARRKEGNKQDVETQLVATIKSSKSQVPSSREAPSSNYQPGMPGPNARVVPRLIGALVFGYSLVLGAWSLELARYGRSGTAESWSIGLLGCSSRLHYSHTPSLRYAFKHPIEVAFVARA